MGRVAAALAALCLIVGLTTAGSALAADPTFPRLTGPVVDDAHVLTPTVVADLAQRADAVQKQSGRQLVVATVPSLQGLQIEDYGYRLGRAWAIGEKGKNNGLILLVAPTERKVRVEVGYGLEGDITDALSSVVVNEKILPRFRAGDIPGGVQAGGDALADLMTLPSDQLQQQSAQAAAAPPPQASQTRHASHGFPIVFLVFVMIWVFSAIFRGRRRYGASGGGGGGWLPWVILGALSSRSGGDDGWGGGGGGGGGDFGGGGGGGFSGGGGSFGGGGSSGSW